MKKVLIFTVKLILASFVLLTMFFGFLIHLLFVIPNAISSFLMWKPYSAIEQLRNWKTPIMVF